VNAAATRPVSPQAATFLRRSLAWLLDAIVLSLLATALAWRWIAPAAAGFITSFRALSDAVAQKLVDGMLAGTQAPVLVHALVRDPALLLAAQRVQDASWALLVPWCAAYALLAFAWHVAGDLSPWRGSPGKRLFGLRVETSEGRAPAPLQAAVREAGSALSWLTLNLGHLLALLPPKRQSLHDRLAGTRVVQR
jgi:uncharacterized RDD family membrane protein YckC